MSQNLTFPSRGSSYGPLLWPAMVSVTSSPHFFPATLQCLGAEQRIKVGIFCFFVNIFMKLSASTTLTVLVWAVLFIKNKDLIKKTYCFFHFYCPNFCENLINNNSSPVATSPYSFCSWFCQCFWIYNKFLSLCQTFCLSFLLLVCLPVVDASAVFLDRLISRLLFFCKFIMTQRIVHSFVW